MKMINNEHKFKTEKQDKKGSIMRFIGAFLIFALVFGSISAAVIIKNNDISIKRIFAGEDATDVPEAPETSDAGITQPISGSYNFLLYCTDSITGDFHFIVIVTADMDGKTFAVRPLNTENENYVNALKTGGSAELAVEVEKAENITITNYAASDTETFATAVNYMGGLEYAVDNRIEYRTDELTLILTPGNQTIRGDTLMKYFRYCKTLGNEGLKTQGELIAAMLDSYINSENLENGITIYQKLLAKIRSDSDISYIEAAKGIDALRTFCASEERTPASVIVNIH